MQSDDKAGGSCAVPAIIGESFCFLHSDTGRAAQLKRLIALYPEYRDPHVVADLINQIWKNYPEVLGEGTSQ